MDKKKPKRPRDPNQLGKLIVDLSVGEVNDEQKDDGKDPAAVSMGKRGGKARADKLSPKRRKEIARKAAESRWKKKSVDKNSKKS